MARTVTAVVTHDGGCLGAVGPFAVEDPWWADVRGVVAHVEGVLGVPVFVLRLLAVHGSDGARDGEVTYHVDALERPAATLTPVGFIEDDHPLRLPWARAAGIRDLLAWAARRVEPRGRPVQWRTWNLAGAFRLPIADGCVWLKATPPFNAAEPIAIAAAAAVDPALVPTVLARAPGRLLMADIPGEDCWDAPVPVIDEAVGRLVRAQARIEPPAGVPDRRPGVLAAAVTALLDGPVGAELTADELRAARALNERWAALEDCGLPDVLVHGDFHPGNWRSDGGPPVVFDWADAHRGNPFLDGCRAIDFLPADRRPAAADAWVRAWTLAAPGSRPADALRIGEPLAHLAYAVRYQEFLDGIEPSEQIYHDGDPAASIRHALTSGNT